MKFFLASAMCLFIMAACRAQDNPYSIFGYKPKVQYKTNQIDVYKVKNNDPNSNIKYLIFDREYKKIRLLDERDSVIQSITYTDEDLLRWMSVDPYAKKYPSMSPYNYGANNPIRNIDMNGDSLRTRGSATATASMKKVAETGMGGNATMTQAKNGNWTLSALTDDQALNMTPEQAEMYKSLSTIISDPNTASFHLIDEKNSLSKDILFGDNGTAVDSRGKSVSADRGVHTIDMGDIKNLGTTGIETAQGMLGHEFEEGYQIQVKGMGGDDAHYGPAIATENKINGYNRLSTRGRADMAGNIVVLSFDIGGGQVQTVTINTTNNNFQSINVNNNQVQ